MPRKTTQMIVSAGRPSDYSDDLLQEIMKHLQDGMTLYEISKEKGMPSFMTLSNWRRSKPEFFYILTAVEEDRAREIHRTARNATKVLEKAVASLNELGALANYQAIKAVVDCLDKTAKVQIVKGDAPPTVDSSEEIASMRAQLDSLHPMTQDKIRQALIEDRQLRGEDDDEES
jgi:hypothetical protein